MLLVIDVGNTNTVLGLMNGREVVRTFRVSTIPRTTDEFGVLMLTMFEARGVDKHAIQGVMVSTVVPSILYSLEKACRRYLGLDALVVGRKLKTGMKVRTDNPREVGADRIVNAVAAVDKWDGPLVVVDFGTATTFDCVTAAGEYIGGAIAPGLRIAEEALFSRTAKLPRVEVARPASPVGTNTVSAIQSGLFYGYVGLVDGLARRCRETLDPQATVVATGGLSNLIGQESSEIHHVDAYLTLRGLAILYEKNT